MRRIEAKAIEQRPVSTMDEKDGLLNREAWDERDKRVSDLVG